jgi:hypothetical protein
MKRLYQTEGAVALALSLKARTLGLDEVQELSETSRERR